MFNIRYNNLKNSKKNYSINLRNKENNTYKLHEKITTSLNHSTQSNMSETTATKSNTNKTFSSTYNKIPVNDKNSYIIKKCSYLDFLELRKTKNTYPFGNKEKRFKWQNLKDENIIVYPEIYKKPHKKQFLLKENFGEDIFYNNKNEFENKPKIKRLRRCHSELGGVMTNHIQNINIDISQRVIDPLFNKEIEKISKKKSFSQSKFLLHRTNGGLKSLFELTPIDIPIIGKRLFKNKSYENINIFDTNYAKYQMPTNIKKQFFDNKCYYDHIKDENLISEMNKTWKFKSNKSVIPGFKTDFEFFVNKNAKNMRLRNYENDKLNKTVSFKSLSKIKRNNNKNIK